MCVTQHTGPTALRPIRRTKQLCLSVLLKDTSAATGQAGIRTHILTTSELESNALDRSATTLQPASEWVRGGCKMPDAKYLYSYGATVLGDKIFVAGGSKLDASINVPYIQCYDPALDMWGVVATMPHPLCEHGCVTIEKYMAGRSTRAFSTIARLVP